MKFRSNKAITLVALIITIIILLILAGVSLSMILGENGLINKAQSSVNAYQATSNNEQNFLNKIGDYLEHFEDLVGWNEEKQVNSPKLAEGMIPIKWNGSNWVITTSDDSEWYDYIDTSVNSNANTSKWANVMLSDGKYSNVTPTPDGKSYAANGTEVAIGDLGSMFVWIPRYAYNIKSGVHTASQGEIQIEFLKGKTRISSQGNIFENINEDGSINTSATAGNDKWLIHPAFLNDTSIGGWDRELTGIWVAKFIASNDNSQIKILPNKDSWRNITFVNAFSNCLTMNKQNNIYGLASTSETHLIKNTEWGAVAYLAQSKYGRNKTEIGMNSSSWYTGANNYVSNTNQSTTGNIYGIYDLSGGTHRYIAAGLSDSITNNLQSRDGFKEKYVNRYEASIAQTQYGDAVYETPRWYSDNAAYFTTNEPWLIRGGWYGYSLHGATAQAGAFAYVSHDGSGWGTFKGSLIPCVRFSTGDYSIKMKTPFVI